MALDRCVFAVRPGEGMDLRLLEERVEALGELYGALGASSSRVRAHDDLRLLTGEIVLSEAVTRSPDAEPATGERLLTWGSTPPAGAGGSRGLIEAPDAALRSLPAPLGAIATGEGRARIVATAGGVQTLYAASGAGAEAWSSHAVAAALLATGGVRVVPDAVAELVACEFTGGGRTLLDGVRALPPATVVDISPQAALERSFWPARERWAPLPAVEARAEVPELFLRDLDARARTAPAALLGLTAGLDSRTAAIALRELGIPFATLTYGEPESEDKREAAAIAARLGVAHAAAPFRWWSEDEGMRRMRAEACWSDGAAPVGFARVDWPAPLSHWILGAGAETGRAFYWRWAASACDPGRVLDAAFELNLGGAPRETIHRLRARWREWIEQAEATGHRGLDALDVVYADQRVRRWGRGQAPRLTAELVPAFAGQELARALASLPRQDRLEDGWQRRFIAEREPGLLPPPPRPPEPAALSRRLLAMRMRALRRRLGLPQLGRGAGPGLPWHARPPWDERPRFIEWLRDGVLSSALVRDAFGERWAGEVREGFIAGKPHAGHLALWAGAAVALEEAVSHAGDRRVSGQGP